MGISRQRSSFYKAEQVKYRGTRPQFPLPFLSLAFIHTSLSRMGSDQAAGKRAGGVHYGNRERSRSIYTSHTPSDKPDGVALHYNCSTLEGQPARQASALVREGGTCNFIKERKKKRNKCVSRTDTNPPFAFQTAFPRGTDFTGFLQGAPKSYIRCL